MNPPMAAKSMTITGPKNKRYTLQKTVIPRGTSRDAKKNKPTASHVRIRTDKTPRLLLGFSIVSANVLMEHNAQVSDRSQPPLMFDLSLVEPAGYGSLHRRVRLSPPRRLCPSRPPNIFGTSGPGRNRKHL